MNNELQRLQQLLSLLDAQIISYSEAREILLGNPKKKQFQDDLTIILKEDENGD